MALGPRSSCIFPRGVRNATVLSALAVSLLVGRAAAAAGEHEWQVALRAGAGTVSVDGRKPWGLAGGLDVEYGLTDSWAVRVSFEGSTHDVTKDNDMDTRPAGTIHTDAALIGLTYTFDVLRLVPYGNLQAGLAQLRGAVTTPQSLLAMELGVGADYFVNRHLLAGISFHYLFEPADLFADPLNLGTNPFSFTVTARASYLF
jgi:Outer membrane protein beta-barrel domain